MSNFPDNPGLKHLEAMSVTVLLLQQVDSVR